MWRVKKFRGKEFSTRQFVIGKTQGLEIMTIFNSG